MNTTQPPNRVPPLSARTVRVVAIGILLAVVAAAVIAARLSPESTVEVVPAEMGLIRQFIDERGKTRLPETFLITMPYNGRIEGIDVVEGMPVKKGQVVARVVPTDLELTVEQASAVVERLEAAIRENADTTLEQTGLAQAQQFVESMQSTVEAAEARMESGQARHDYAEKNLARVRNLFEKNAASRDELDRAELEKVEAAVDYRQDRLVYSAMQSLEAATNLLPTMVRQYIDRKTLTRAVLEKEKAEAEAKLRQVLQDQQRGTMASPVDGVVLQRNVTNERYLSAGTALIEIGRLEDLEVEADVLSTELVDVREGDPVEIYGPAIGEPPAKGTVDRIYPAGFTKISSLGVEQQQVKVVVAFLPADLERLRRQRHLGAGYRVRVRIITAAKSQALTVPRSSLFRGTDGGWLVYAVRGGVANVVGVEVGILNDEHAEILSGLEPGDLVVRAPESNLAEGQRVEAIR